MPSYCGDLQVERRDVGLCERETTNGLPEVREQQKALLMSRLLVHVPVMRTQCLQRLVHLKVTKS